jgi:hypothetical protein
MKCLLLALLLLETAAGFQSVTELYLARVSNKNRGTPQSLSITGYSSATPEEARAAALSEYLAKSHEEKLRAIKEVETKKNAEIDALKEEITELRQSIPTTSSIVMTNNSVNTMALEDLTKEELMYKVVQYQNWIRQYMIDAQEQKMRAVQAAEDGAKKKWAEAMMLLNAASSTTVETTTISTQSPLYAARNVAVSKAAVAGKSRWGDMEVQRASGKAIPTAAEQPKVVTVNGATAHAVTVNGATASPAAAASAVSVSVPPEVAAADHGLRADGGVGGLTLAERVYFGAAASAPELTAAPASSAVPVLATTSHLDILYAQRNMKVLEAAKAGKSRWGPQEVERVQNIAAATPAFPAAAAPAAPAISVPVPPEVAAADHGLRADGGVDGLTLAERIYFGFAATAPELSGAAAAAASSTVPVLSAPSHLEVLYTQRNIKVLQAAKAGKSRWGPQEVERVQNIVAATPSLPAAANGASFVPTSEERINLGASIVARQ